MASLIKNILSTVFFVFVLNNYSAHAVGSELFDSCMSSISPHLPKIQSIEHVPFLNKVEAALYTVALVLKTAIENGSYDESEESLERLKNKLVLHDRIRLAADSLAFFGGYHQKHFAIVIIIDDLFNYMITSTREKTSKSGKEILEARAKRRYGGVLSFVEWVATLCVLFNRTTNLSDIERYQVLEALRFVAHQGDSDLHSPHTIPEVQSFLTILACAWLAHEIQSYKQTYDYELRQIEARGQQPNF